MERGERRGKRRIATKSHKKSHNAAMPRPGFVFDYAVAGKMSHDWLHNYGVCGKGRLFLFKADLLVDEIWRHASDCVEDMA
jgi:hypothetical protein